MRHRHDSQGFAIATVLVVIAVMAVMAGTVVTISVQGLNRASTSVADAQAFFAANAGIEQTVETLEQDPTFSKGYSNVLLPAQYGSYTVVVTNNLQGSASVTSPNGVVVPPLYAYILSTGYAAQSPGEQRIGALYYGQNGLDFGVFGNDGLTIRGTPVIDSFNSTVGPYSLTGSTNPANLFIGTNGTQDGAVTLKDGSDVKGNVRIGPGGNVSTAIVTSPGSKITGNTGDLPAALSFNAPSVPSGPMQGAVNGPPAGGVLPPGNYQSLSLSDRDALTLTAGTYYFQDGVSTSDRSTIAIDTSNGPVKLLFGGSFDGSGCTITNASAVPGNFLIEGTASATSAQLAGGDHSYYVFFAPTADVSLVGSADMYGTVVGKTFTQVGTAGIHYDIALRNVNTGFVNTGFQTLSQACWTRL